MPLGRFALVIPRFEANRIIRVARSLGVRFQSFVSLKGPRTNVTESMAARHVPLGQLGPASSVQRTGTCGVIVPVPFVPAGMLEFVLPLRFTKNVSSGSSVLSLQTVTLTCLDVSPGANVSVAKDMLTKSVPPPQFAPPVAVAPVGSVT